MIWLKCTKSKITLIGDWSGNGKTNPSSLSCDCMNWNQQQKLFCPFVKQRCSINMYCTCTMDLKTMKNQWIFSWFFHRFQIHSDLYNLLYMRTWSKTCKLKSKSIIKIISFKRSTKTKYVLGNNLWLG